MEISRGVALDESFRAIALRIKRAPTTALLEVYNNGGRTGYRAVVVGAAVAGQSKRPKASKLASDPILRRTIEETLVEFWSPE